ncbi:E3 ubiquitin-protein ligase ZNF598 [Elysia marginata]|uniref:RING-type E3 ubiquitin transferase n=1 Tax=Elysia marginata TaxID=1093978 RepID=A0AAV4JCZ0_9GAST|nr:E3 ubiquitin-protein ligase ZNF598 [Elysia marginata]
MSGNRSKQVERTVSESGENICPVCHDPILIFAIGPCDHPVCHRCATRMRVLCEKNDCPICRAVSPQVAFVYHKQPFQNINLRDCIPNRKYKIFFEDEEVEDSYLDLLEYRCKLCPKRGAEKSFALLQTHMRREHQLFACDLCTSHLKIFPFERKFYNRKNLATHRRVGDADDKSYKGHPLCEFCDTRYFDKDELMKHLRKDHFFCHFCDQQGSNAYYDQYEDLMQHFKGSHYLCTEGECGNSSTRFTHAFVSEIDLKAHKASAHGKNLTKAQSREARTLEVEFQLPPRRRGGDYNSDYRSGQGQRGGDKHKGRRDYNNREDADMQQAIEASKKTFANEANETRPPVAERVPDPVRDFPSLNGAAPVAPTNMVSSIPSGPAKSPEEDFPSLSSCIKGSSSGSRKTTTAPSKAYSSIMNPPPRPAPAPVNKESRPVPLGLVSASIKGRYAAPPVNSETDYPLLGGATARPPQANQGSWLSKTQPSNTSASVITSSKTLAISKVPTRQVPVTKVATFKKAVTDENEFPSLGGRDKKKANGLGNPFAEWSTTQNGPQKKTVIPKSEKVVDDTFELPDSYFMPVADISGHYTSVVDPTASSNITMVETAPEPAVKTSSKPLLTSNSTKDFPGLPGREKKPVETSNEKKKKKNNKKTRDKPNGHEKNPPEAANASLSDIALALVKPEPKPANLKNFSSNSNEKSVVKKPTDWFDSPNEELKKNTKASQKQEQQLNGSSHKTGQSNVEQVLSEESSSSSIKDNFPSVHTMSTSVQLQPQQLPQGPPGFSSTTPLAPKAVPTPPPGFGAPAAGLLSLKSISSTLNSVPTPPPGFTPNSVYTQPPDFKGRNCKLIEDIRSALETVEDGFSNFRVLSGQFRQGMMEASDYHCSVRALVGAVDFDRIFPELIALLPDIMKQKQLWEVDQAARSSRGNSKRSELSQCATCGQVIRTSDLQHHRLQCVESSKDSDNFPSLNGLSNDGVEGRTAVASGLKVNGAWIKAK